MSSRNGAWRHEKYGGNIHQERGEHYIDYVKRSISAGRLVDPKKLVYDLALLNDGTSHSAICEVIIHQYKLAKDFADLRRIETVRTECTTILCTKRWVDEHLPSLINPPSRKRVRSSSTMSSATSAEMCRDVRLHSNPDQPIIQENAAKSECPSSSGVCEAADTSNVTVTFHTADEVDGFNSSKRRRCVIDDECIVTCTSSSSSSLQKCPFPGCNKRERKIKRHVQKTHLPRIFNDVKPLKSLDDESLREIQVRSLESLVRYVLGENADLWEAVDYLNCSTMIPSNAVLHNDTVTSMKRICAYKGWSEPSEGFKISPLNSPAALVHWRCVLSLMTHLKPTQREEFRVHGYVVSNNSLATPTPTENSGGTNNDASTDEFTVIDVSYGSDYDDRQPAIEKQKLTIPDLNKAFDSHFHLDRTVSKIWKHSVPSDKTAEDLLSYTYRSNSPPQLTVSLTGGVINYSEPSTHPEFIEPNGFRGIALGVHPKHIGELTEERFLHLKTMLAFPSVVGLGEIGLDWTVPPNLWRKQEEVFRKVLSLVRQEKVLILHLRPAGADIIGMDVHARCMQILHKFCGYTQPIHVHCFMGDAELVNEWMTNYSNVYFGFTGAVENFGTDQIAGLQLVPMNRILLETDSPYMRPGGGGINTPAFIGDVASIVASKLRIPVQHLFKVLFRIVVNYMAVRLY